MAIVDRRAPAPDAAGSRRPQVLSEPLIQRLLSHASAGDSPPVSIVAPATGEALVQLPQSSHADIEGAFARARRVGREWARVPVRRRQAILRRFHDIVVREQDTILDIVQAETGKSRVHAFDELADVLINSRYYSAVTEKLLSPRHPRGLVPGLTRVQVNHRPKGVVAVISPWNYPLALAVSDALPALLAGNAVIGRPDNQTALSALWAVDAALRAGFPPGLWQVVLGPGRTIGSELISRADFVDFTGSSATGQTIGRQAGERLIGCSLELGGKNPMVVRADADITTAARNATRACFASAGQLCESIERIYVHEQVYDEFLGRFSDGVQAMKLGAQWDFSSDMGSLTSQRQLDTVTAHVQDAVDKGATVVTGGRPRPDLGPFFYEPTVLTGVRPGMTAYREETFGPVVAVYPVASDAEAIAQANDTSYGLNASVWTGDIARGREVAAQLHAGTVNVNEGFVASWGSADAPIGGLGKSGTGRRHGPEGLLKYVETQTVAVQRLLPIAPPKGVSEELWAKSLVLLLRALRLLRRR